MSVSSLLNKTATHERVWTGAVWEWKRTRYASDLHSISVNEEDPFRCLNQPLNGSQLVQKTHRRSPYGPDYPYLPRPYPEMDGLTYRFYDGPAKPQVGSPVQENQQNIAAEQAASNGRHPAHVEDAPEGPRENEEYRGNTLPRMSFQGAGTQNDPIMLGPDTSLEAVNSRPAVASFEAFLHSSPQQYTLPNEDRLHRILLPSNNRAGPQIPLAQTLRNAGAEEFHQCFRRSNNFEGHRDFDDFISNATQEEVDAFFNQRPFQQMPVTAGQHHP